MQMPSVKLPLLIGNVTVRKLTRSLAENDVAGAVIRRGKTYHTYHLVTLSEVDDFVRTKKSGSIAGLEGITLAGGSFVVASDSLSVQIDSYVSNAPRYKCPQGDFVSSSPGKCIYHTGTDLVPSKAP
jgi:hypothetical protein